LRRELGKLRRGGEAVKRRWTITASFKLKTRQNCNRAH
jgi:hypothetical protein